MNPRTTRKIWFLKNHAELLQKISSRHGECGSPPGSKNWAYTPGMSKDTCPFHFSGIYRPGETRLQGFVFPGSQKKKTKSSPKRRKLQNLQIRRGRWAAIKSRGNEEIIAVMGENRPPGQVSVPKEIIIVVEISIEHLAYPMIKSVLCWAGRV